MSTSLHDAINAWKECLGTDNLIQDAPSLDVADTATFRTAQCITTILKPADRFQVQECLRIAHRCKTPVYPVSSGKNTGYGSSVPVRDGCALMHLGRMDRIVDYDDKLGYVTIEPGVTQRQLYDFLQQQGGKFWMDATGASENCSIVGNTMERGFGHTPYSDHFANVCALEVVLADGGCIHTGLARYADAKAKPVHRWGVGPSVDGLFSQSNFGLVTQMSVWLMPAPEYFQAFYFSIEDDSGLEGLIDTLRPLRLERTINSAAHIGNAYRVLSTIQQYPWEAAGHRTPLGQNVLDELGRKWDFGAWNGTAALYGTRRQVGEARRKIKAALHGRVKKIRFIDDAALDLAERLQKPLKWLMRVDVPEMLKLVRPVHDMMKGVPTDQVLNSTYWRKRMPVPTPARPERDRCGLIWCSPIAATDGMQARAMADIATETVLGHGFEPGMTLTLLTERCLENVISIMYDRDVEGEDERAMECYRELLGKLIRERFYPYRLGIQSMDGLPGAADGNHEFLRKLKQTLDPHSILAPGRYGL